MTTEDDVQRLGELSRELPAIDVDTITAERIARRARDDVGKGPSPRRLVEPAVVSLIVLGYLVWVIVKILEALR
jgi:hypothetical protein